MQLLRRRSSAADGPSRPGSRLASPRRHGAARRAMGHNVFAAVMLVALPLAGLGLVGTFVYYSGVADEYLGAPAADAGRGEAVKTDRTTLSRPTFSRFDRKGQTYTVTSKSAAQQVDNPAVVLLDEVKINLRLKPSTGDVVVTSSKGAYDADKRRLRLVGNVRIVSQQGYSAALSSAEVLLDARRITTSEPVFVTLPNGTIEGNAAELSDDGDKLRFFNKVRLIFTQDGSGAVEGQRQ